MNWQPRQRFRHSLPPPLVPWLLDRSSLTDSLMRESKGDFRVEILSQHWGSCRPDEGRVLGLPPRARVFIREVILQGRGEPWVYARSILPARSLGHSLRYLKRIGTKPLGAVLFSNPKLQRSDIEIAQLLPNELPLAIAGSVWGRRSVFFLRHQPLLVSEVFLPDFIAHLGRT